MLIWITSATALLAASGALLVEARAYLLAIYLWRKTRQLSVLRDVAEFETAISQAGSRNVEEPVLGGAEAGRDERAADDPRQLAGQLVSGSATTVRAHTAHAVPRGTI
ncbi:hypothetical protein [Catellatospora vulcania]|uniref:hypothetical protein n=1 Tax=Catellatospora vulcania TaxID=1460450 RepID=UPI0012D3BDAA|nr:hypothetical protein [Catellatospora vulcania]